MTACTPSAAFAPTTADSSPLNLPRAASAPKKNPRMATVMTSSGASDRSV
jgi:hypothetical protein